MDLLIAHLDVLSLAPETFRLEMSLLEIILRGTLVYLVIAMIIRFIPKRHTGNLSANDLIALVVVGNLAGYAIVGTARSIPDVLLLLVIVLLWDYLLNIVEYYFPRLRKVVQHSPTLLIHNGILLKDSLRKEKLTEQELAASLRRQGIEDIQRVKQAILETDGHISVIPNE